MNVKTISRSDAVSRMCAIEDEVDDLEVEGLSTSHPTVKRLVEEAEHLEAWLQSDEIEIPVKEPCCVCEQRWPEVGQDDRKVFCYSCFNHINELFTQGKTARQIAQGNDWLAQQISNVAPLWAQLKEEVQ